MEIFIEINYLPPNLICRLFKINNLILNMCIVVIVDITIANFINEGHKKDRET